MKLTACFFTFIIFIGSATTVFAADPPMSRVNTNPDLKRVLAELHELKEEIQQLKRLMIKHHRSSNQSNKHPVAQPTSWSCYLNIPYSGSFSASGHTKNEALGKTLAKCNHKLHNSASCDDHWLKGSDPFY